jgi:hypothetical protein
MRLSFFILTSALLACNSPDLEKDAPSCIKKKIKEIQNEEVYNPPAEVWEWKVDGKTYYYFTSSCCDQYNYLYDEDCNQICAPDGGFTGNGDGTCPNFNGTIQKSLVWRDNRN